MSDRAKITRKIFISQCGKAALGLGLGTACGKPGGTGSAGAPRADSLAVPAATTQVEPVTPAYRTLGKAKIRVTEIGYGASRTMDPTLINYALKSGINFIDTGRSYFNGQNELLIGKVIKERREQVVINSKIPPGSLEKMRKDLETSLKALGTDYVDCLLIHGASTPEESHGEATLEFLSRAKEQGQARTIGFSSHSNFIQLTGLAAERGFHEVIMLPYNFLGRYTHMLGGSKDEWDSEALEKAIRKAGETGIDFISMKGCSGGFMKDEQGRETYPAALRWILRNPYFKTTATAMGNFQQIEENARAMGKGAPGPLETGFLDRYARLHGESYCRMCGSCRGQCPNGVAVAEVNRFHMYAAGYGGHMVQEGRKSYAALGRAGARACTSCQSCTVVCPYGLPLGRKLKEAHAVLSA